MPVLIRYGNVAIRTCFFYDAVHYVLHVGVHYQHCLVADSGIWVHLLQHLVDVDVEFPLVHAGLLAASHCYDLSLLPLFFGVFVYQSFQEYFGQNKLSLKGREEGRDLHCQAFSFSARGFVCQAVMGA